MGVAACPLIWWGTGEQGNGEQGSGGDEFDKTKCNSEESGTGDITPIGKYPEGASPYGALGMAGNVWEWCNSLYEKYPYRADDGREDQETKDLRVLRGGSWSGNEGFARCASRHVIDPDYFSSGIGFRVVSLPKAGRGWRKLGFSRTIQIGERSGTKR